MTNPTSTTLSVVCPSNYQITQIDPNQTVAQATKSGKPPISQWILQDAFFKAPKDFKTIVKVPKNVLDFLHAYGKLSEQGENARGLLHTINGFLGIPAVMSKLYDSYTEFTIMTNNQFSTSRRWKAFAETILNGNDAVPDAVGFIRTLKQIKAIDFGEKGSKILDWAATPALLLGSISGIIHQSCEIDQSAKALKDKGLPKHLAKEEKARISHAALSLVKSITYLALSVIGILGLALALVCPVWVGLSLAATTTAIALSMIIHDRFTSYKKRNTAQKLPMAQVPIQFNIEEHNSPKGSTKSNDGDGSATGSGDHPNPSDGTRSVGNEATDNSTKE